MKAMLTSFRCATCLLALLAALSAGPIRAQPALVPVAPVPITQTASETETLRALASSHVNLLKSIEAQQATVKVAVGTPAADAAQRELAELEARRLALEQDFSAVAAGVTSEEYLGKKEDDTPLSLEQELSRLLIPMVSEVRKLSKKPRALQELQDSLLQQERRGELAHVAVTNLQTQLKALAAAKEPKQSDLTKLLQRLLENWETRLSESQSRALAIERQIDELRGDDVGIWGTLADAGQTFVVTRGRNILLAIAAFVGVFFGLRLLYFYGLKLVPISKMERLSFFSRLLGLLNQSLSLALGVLAALAVLYASGDWLLGGIAMLILIAIAIAAKNGLVNYFEQVRMLLNLGGAREGERVLIEGVPWRIGKINLQTRLTNPCIDGPGLRVPLEDLMEMTSRACGKHEAWFPCRIGNTFLLGDDLLAKVEHISPDFVEITYRGGVTRQIPTPEFIKLQPANLSEGFLVSSTFGLGYRHQADITTRIPEQLRADLHAALQAIVPQEQLLDVKVVFKEAAASSLDLLLIAKFSGGAAEQYLDLRRQLQQIAVDSCNRHGWLIPFPQLVVHQADAETK
jgi:hypothetical protein